MKKLLLITIVLLSIIASGLFLSYRISTDMIFNPEFKYPTSLKFVDYYMEGKDYYIGIDLTKSILNVYNKNLSVYTVDISQNKDLFTNLVLKWNFIKEQGTEKVYSPVSSCNYLKIRFENSNFKNPAYIQCIENF